MNEQLDLFGFNSAPAQPSPPGIPLEPTAAPKLQSVKLEPPPAAEPLTISTAPLEILAKTLLRNLGCPTLAEQVHIRWNSRMRSTAGYAIPARQLILLNPKLFAFEGELERTMRHELAHLLAHHRAGKRRIAAHGPEWQQACADLGIPQETRCHNLPLPRRRQNRKYRYACPGCDVIVARVRPIRRKSACLACCRAHSRGQYDERFRLRVIKDA